MYPLNIDNHALNPPFPAKPSLSQFNKKIITIAMGIFIAVGLLLQRNHLAYGVERSYRAFRGEEGWIAFTLLFVTYLGMKIGDFSNKKIGIDQTKSWLKEVPKKLELGICELPHSIYLKTIILALSPLIFKTLSTEASHPKFVEAINEESLFSIAIEAPFFEELFFRDFVQSSSISALKLINSVGFRMGKKTIISEKTILVSSRLFSAIIFGFGHYNQNLNQAISCGVVSYYHETLLFQNHGLITSFGHHSANNFLVFTLIKLLLLKKNFINKT